MTDAIVNNSRRYQSADLAVVDETVYWAILDLDQQGTTSSWLMWCELEGTSPAISCVGWIPDAIQAITATPCGSLLGITVGNLLFTNADMQSREGWAKIEQPASIPPSQHWYSTQLSYGNTDKRVGEVPVALLCLQLSTVLIGTFSRRIYHWGSQTGSGETRAALEYNGKAPDYSGGINDLVKAGAGVIALGYGGTVLSRNADATWQPSAVPWSSDEAEFVNVIAGTMDEQSSLRMIVDGGWVLSSVHDALEPTHRVDGTPLGIANFQGDLVVTTMSGCYRLGNAGQVDALRSDIMLGKTVATKHALFAIDAAPENPDQAGLHIWVRSRLADTWTTRYFG